MIVVVFSNDLAKKANVSSPLIKNDIETFVRLKKIKHFDEIRYEKEGFELIFIDDTVPLDISDLLRGFKHVDKELVFFLHASKVTYYKDGSKKTFGSNSHFEINYEKRSYLDKIIRISERDILEVILFKHEFSCLVFPNLSDIIENVRQDRENSKEKIDYLINKFSTSKRRNLISGVIRNIYDKCHDDSEILRDCKNYNL